MRDSVNEALKNARSEREPIEGAFNKEDADNRPRIAIVGCGGAGNNTINRLRVTGAETIAVDTDRQHLDTVQADRRFLIARSLTKGLGAGGSPEIGRRADEMGRAVLERALEDTVLCFVTAGLGGGTGTGAAPVVAQIAKDQGATVIVLVGYPFNEETARLVRAEEGLAALYRVTGSVVVLDNNRLQPRKQPRLPGAGFTAMDRLIAGTAKAISEAIVEPSLINIDFDDLRTVTAKEGVAVMHVGDADLGSGARGAVRDCLSHPMFDIDFHGATGALIHITGGSDLTLEATEEIVSELVWELDPMTDVTWGARTESGVEGRVRVVAIMTGIRSSRIPRATR